MIIPRRVNDRVWGERNPETEYFVDVTPSLKEISLLAVEEKYSADYVCETELVNASKRGCNIPGLVFYQQTPHPRGSNWFVLYFLNGNQLMIANAKNIVDTLIGGIVADNNEIVFSRYRHDMRSSQDGSVWIDGGRDYVRSGTFPESRYVTMKIEGPNLILQ